MKFADEVLKNPVEYLHTPAVSGLFPKGVPDLKSDFSVCNLIQSIPSTITFEFEQESELPLLLQSNSLIRQQSLMQSLIRSENYKSLKISISEDLKIKVEDFKVEPMNIASKLDMDLIFNYDLKYFSKKLERLLKKINYASDIGARPSDPP